MKKIHKKYTKYKNTQKNTKYNITSHQMEIAKRLNAIIAQLLPFLSQEVGVDDDGVGVDDDDDGDDNDDDDVPET